MSFIRFVSALLFAFVLLALAYGAFWFISLKVTEKQFTTYLANHLGVTASYNSPEWISDFTQVAVRLPNVSVRIALPENARLVLSWPEVMLRSSYFGGSERMKLSFPQQGYAQLTHDGNPVALYTMTTAGNELLLMPGRVQWQVQTAKVGVQMGSGDTGTNPSRELYTFRDGSIVWQTKAGEAAQLQMQAKDIGGVSTVKSLQLDAMLNNLDRLGPVNWALLLQPEKDRVQLWLNRLVETLQEGGQLQVKRLAIRKDNWELDGNGGLTVGRDGVPRGEVSLQSGSGRDLADLIVKAGIATPSTAEEVMRYASALEKLRADTATPLAKLVLHQGVAIVNAQRVGRVPSATTILNGWF